MEKRYQVFVSSTYTDLFEERNEVMQALLELECMPAGMELFPAANESQWNWIKKVIDESDYYLVIVAGRYGTVSKEANLSYTEMEYRYALEKGKPVIGFLHEDISTLPAKLTEQSSQRKKQLLGFRELVQSKLCKFYSSPADLGAKVSRSITQLKKQYPATGWIRADVINNLASSDEVLKLKKENESLKKKLYQFGAEIPKETGALASGNERYEIDFYHVRRTKGSNSDSWKKVGEGWDTIKLSWDHIFKFLSPYLLRGGASRCTIKSLLDNLAEFWGGEMLKDKYPDHRFYQFSISTECLDTIIIQLRALNLISLAKNGFWELTPYGDNYMTKLLAIRKGQTKK